ncbi:MAG: Smr/MutS family protein [Treponema sp.]|nr:Smr/MutS family protein [Treponema sp.]
MNMGDILNQWDTIQKQEAVKKREMAKSTKNQISHKKANAPSLEEKIANKDARLNKPVASSEKRSNPMEVWLRRYGTIDKDKLAEENEERTRQQDKSYLINMRPEAFLDLHGLHKDEAEQKLTVFINTCVRKKIRKILVIHGKGNHTKGTDPVLGEVVRKFIQYNPYCGMSGHPKNREDGGSGATWIILKF